MDDDWLTAHRPLTRWLAVLAPVAVGALLGLLRTGMETSTAAMVLVLTVVASAATGDRVAGVAGRSPSSGPACRPMPSPPCRCADAARWSATSGS